MNVGTGFFLCMWVIGGFVVVWYFIDFVGCTMWLLVIYCLYGFFFMIVLLRKQGIHLLQFAGCCFGTKFLHIISCHYYDSCLLCCLYLLQFL